MKEIEINTIIELKSNPIDLTQFNRGKEELRSVYYDKKLEPFRFTFTLEWIDVQNFLLNKGYKFAIIEGYANISTTETNSDMEVRVISNSAQVRKGIIAIKIKEESIIRSKFPLFIDGKEFYNYDLLEVFMMEFKKHLLFVEPKLY